MPSPPPESRAAPRPGPSRPSITSIILLTAGGLFSGWISGTLILRLSDTYSAELWVPGACFAAWTVAATWGPTGLPTRTRVKRSAAWNLGIFAGVVCSYIASYYAAFWTVALLPNDVSGFSASKFWSLMVGGLVGSAIGSAGLVNLWSLLFSHLGDLRVRSILIAWGSLLGTFLALSSPDYTSAEWHPSPALFVTWQGGMAMALCLADRFGGNPTSAQA